MSSIEFCEMLQKIGYGEWLKEREKEEGKKRVGGKSTSSGRREQGPLRAMEYEWLFTGSRSRAFVRWLVEMELDEGNVLTAEEARAVGLLPEDEAAAMLAMGTHLREEERGRGMGVRVEEE
jgi:hypothetical protein